MGLAVQFGIVGLDLSHLSSASGLTPPPLSLQHAHALQFSVPQLSPPFHLHHNLWLMLDPYLGVHSRDVHLIDTLKRSLGNFTSSKQHSN